MPWVFVDEIDIFLLRDNVDPSGILKNSEFGSSEGIDWQDVMISGAIQSINNLNNLDNLNNLIVIPFYNAAGK